jgi:hypothetical protein
VFLFTLEDLLQQVTRDKIANAFGNRRYPHANH